MAMTMQEYTGRTKDMLEKGVLNTMMRTSDFLANINIIESDSLNYRFNVSKYFKDMNFVPAGADYSAEDTLTETVNIGLKFMQEVADVPLQFTDGQNVASLRADETQIKVENLMKNLEKSIFYADPEVDVNAFKGFDAFISEDLGSKFESEELTYDDLLNLVDAVPNATVLACNKKMVRKIATVLKKEGFELGSILSEGGKVIQHFDGIKVFTTESIKDNEIFCCEFSETGVSLVTCNGLFNVRDIGLMESKAVFRTVIHGNWAPVVRQKNALSKWSIKESTPPTEGGETKTRRRVGK